MDIAKLDDDNSHLGAVLESEDAESAVPAPAAFDHRDSPDDIKSTDMEPTSRGQGESLFKCLHEMGVPFTEGDEVPVSVARRSLGIQAPAAKAQAGADSHAAFPRDDLGPVFRTQGGCSCWFGLLDSWPCSGNAWCAGGFCG